MDYEIFVEPYELWGFYLEVENCLESQIHILAENEEGIKICLAENDSSDPVIRVFFCGDEVEDFDFDFSTAEYTLSEVYETYLYSEGFSEQLSLDEDEECYDCENRGFSLVEHQDEMDSREYELSDAVENFIETALNFEESEVLDDVIIEDCKEHFLKYLASKHGITGIYRPMILEDEDGEDFFTEYPYECLVFDEEDG